MVAGASTAALTVSRSLSSSGLKSKTQTSPVNLDTGNILNALRKWDKNGVDAHAHLAEQLKILKCGQDGGVNMDLMGYDFPWFPNFIFTRSTFSGQYDCRMITVLNVSYNRIERLPDDIYGLAQLTKLYLGHNWLSSMPQTLSMLSELTLLDLQHNPLFDLPDSYQNLTKLEVLYLNGCNFRVLPRVVLHMPRLGVLDVVGNTFYPYPDVPYQNSVNLIREYANVSRPTALNLVFDHDTFTEEDKSEILGICCDYPRAMGFILVTGLNKGKLMELFLGWMALFQFSFEYHQKILLKLEHSGYDPVNQLVELDVSSLNLPYFPNPVTAFSAIQKLDLSKNDFQDKPFRRIPNTMGDLRGLAYLDLSNNQSLCERCFPSTMGHLKALTWLDLRDCSIAVLPLCIYELEALEDLYLARNKLKTLDPSIENLENLETLDISEMALDSLPESLLFSFNSALTVLISKAINKAIEDWVLHYESHDLYEGPEFEWV